MSNRSKRGKKSENSTNLWVKILAFILAALMILSVAYIALSFIFTGYAAEAELDRYAFAGTVGDRDATYVSVALKYGSSVMPSYVVTSPYGFVVGETYISRTDRRFSPVYKLEDTSVVLACDSNLTVGYKSCSFSASAAKTDIGSYHVELALPQGTQGDVWDSLSALSGMLAVKFEHVFPAYVNSEHVIRIGSFATFALATSAAAEIGATVDGYDINVASPANDGLCILNEDYDTILFEYAGSEYCYGGICAVQPESGEKAYLCNQLNSYLYDGVFCFKRYTTASADGFLLINLLELYEYCLGVLPAEIYPSWNLECLKAFAITVNSFTIANLNKRFSTYGCDLIASSNDQNYSGQEHNVNANVRQAVAEAKHQVLIYRGEKKVELVCGYYTQAQGGCSVDTQWVWGGETGPFICSQPTPWEEYSSLSTSGIWYTEVTPANLAKTIKANNKSLSSLGTSIANVEYEITGDSTYVYTTTYTDTKGKSATVTKCSNVKNTLGSLAKSANFVIGKDSVEYTYEDVLSVEIIDLNNYSGNLYVRTANGTFSSTASLFNFMTDLGRALTDRSKAMYVKTENGTAVLISEGDIPMTTLPDSKGIYTYVSNYGSFIIVTKLQEFTKTYKAKTSGNFVIVGKGSGHGVGMSAYGMNFLAKDGALAHHILYAYFPGSEIVSLNDYWDLK